MAEDMATRRRTLGSMPIFFARFQAITMKRMLIAMTNSMTIAVMAYMSGPFGSNILNTSLFRVRQVYHKARILTTKTGGGKFRLRCASIQLRVIRIAEIGAAVNVVCKFERHSALPSAGLEHDPPVVQNTLTPQQPKRG